MFFDERMDSVQKRIDSTYERMLAQEGRDLVQERMFAQEGWI